MEHRWSPRINEALEVEISHCERLVGRYRTRNFCYEGMFVEAGQSDLCRHDVVDLRLDAGAVSVHLRGLVAHHSAEGVGVMVVDYNPAYCQIIFDALRRRGSHSWSASGNAPCLSVGRDGPFSDVEARDSASTTIRASESNALRVTAGERLGSGSDSEARTTRVAP